MLVRLLVEEMTYCVFEAPMLATSGLKIFLGS